MLGGQPGIASSPLVFFFFLTLIKFIPIPKIQFRFWYHMFGDNVNRLTVYQRISQMEFPTPVLTYEGDQGDQWLRAEISFTIGAKFQVCYMGVVYLKF